MSVTLHTDLGDLKIEVFCEAVPKTAEWILRQQLIPQFWTNTSNILIKICENFHAGKKKYKIIYSAGDPTGTGKGGNSIWGRKFADEIKSSLKHNARGIVSMANSGPDTNGSQFFITYTKLPHLDTKYTVFGKVIDGVDTTLDAIEKVPVDEKNRPIQEIRIKSVTIHANPLAE
ncbi:1849_t:CDS:2 [Ambispora gerdemannii]|uniref:Peptidyl-prolyl cis-trans isomerase n=1 Tax=Ambispora gerdemannii TaxID=144530 RepID=A0A9N8YV33_9GLOM|nr:1849_t:CDS:2 [Ambispora gerdemannii]